MCCGQTSLVEEEPSYSLFVQTTSVSPLLTYSEDTVPRTPLFGKPLACLLEEYVSG